MLGIFGNRRDKETTTPLGQAGLDLAEGNGKRKGQAAASRMLAKVRQTVSDIAKAGVQVSRLAPQLDELATAVESRAAEAARRASDMESAAGEMTQEVHTVSEDTKKAAQFSTQVGDAVRELAASSQRIGEVMTLIHQVATQTRMLSLNAAVEAARAGEAGKGFAVVAQEVQNLSGQTMEAARRAEEILNGIGGEVQRLSRSIGGEDDQDGLVGVMAQMAEASRRQDERVSAITAEIAEVAADARRQSDDATRLSRLGGGLREHTEELLTSLGEFRFEAHQKAAQVVEELASSGEALGDRQRREGMMRRAVERHRFLELLYLTDASGRQVTENIAPGNFQASYGSALGRDWSSRPWFRGALARQGTHITGIYRSAATQSFCFTVAAPIWGTRGELVGVMAADVNFADLMEA